MNIRNTIKNTAEEVQTARCKDFGVNLISIDSHSGARPKCAKDQGKIFDLNNGSGEVEDARGRKVKYYPWNSSSYGEPDGILGINCRHHKHPFIPRVNIHRYFPTEDMDENNELYKQTQKQRQLEREVRKQKRECVLMKGLVNAEEMDRAATKLKHKQNRLEAYIENHKELHRRKDRERVVGYDKDVSAKVNGINKRKKSLEDMLNNSPMTKSKSKDKKQYDKYKAVLGDLIGTIEEFEDIKYNDVDKWRELKYQYRTVNRYEVDGNVSARQILKLDSIAFYEKKKGFDFDKLKKLGLNSKKRRDIINNLKNGGNAAVMEFEGITYFSHSKFGVDKTLEIELYKDNYPAIPLSLKRIFKVKDLGDGIPRQYDTEAKFLEFVAKQKQPEDTFTITILSEKHICKSCEYVVEQFKQMFPNATVNIISGKKGYNRSEEGTNTWKYRKKVK